MTAVQDRTPEEQFALLLDGELRPDEVAEELRSLYALAGAVEQHVLVPRPEFAFRAELREWLAASAEEQMGSVWDRIRDAATARTTSIRNSVRAAVASGVMASMIGTAGIAAASQQALPGELLYPVKELTESARLALSGNLAASGRLHLRFAQERLEEVDEGAQALRADLLIDTLDAMDAESIDGAEDLFGYAARTADEAVLAELRAFTDAQRDQLQGIIGRLPSAVVPFAEDSLEVLRRITNELDGEPQPCDCPVPDGPVAAPGTDAPVIAEPGQAPAGNVPRPCQCTSASDDPALPRENPITDDRPREEQPSGEPPTTDPDPVTDEPVDLVPELPGPLDPVGDLLDDLVNDVLDGTAPVTDPLPVDPKDDVVAPLDRTVDDLLDDAPLPPAPTG